MRYEIGKYDSSSLRFLEMAHIQVYSPSVCLLRCVPIALCTKLSTFHTDSIPRREGRLHSSRLHSNFPDGFVLLVLQMQKCGQNNLISRRTFNLQVVDRTIKITVSNFITTPSSWSSYLSRYWLKINENKQILFAEWLCSPVLQNIRCKNSQQAWKVWSKKAAWVDKDSEESGKHNRFISLTVTEILSI